MNKNKIYGLLFFEHRAHQDIDTRKCYYFDIWSSFMVYRIFWRHKRKRVQRKTIQRKMAMKKIVVKVKKMSLLWFTRKWSLCGSPEPDQTPDLRNSNLSMPSSQKLRIWRKQNWPRLTSFWDHFSKSFKLFFEIDEKYLLKKYYDI